MKQNKNLLGAETLVEAFELITGTRQSAYGHPEADYRRTAQIFEALTGIQLTVEEAILFMVAVKLSRLTTNLEHNTFHRDSLVDAAGYLGCLAMVEARRQARRENRNAQ